jgi:hypothetical protein
MEISRFIQNGKKQAEKTSFDQLLNANGIITKQL